MELDHHS